MHALRPILRLLVLFLLTQVTGCADAGNVSQSSVIDSGGVTIIMSASPSWPAGEGWRLSTEPMLALGFAEGAPEFEFQTILGLTRLSNGNVVVGNKIT